MKKYTFTEKELTDIKNTYAAEVIGDNEVEDNDRSIQNNRLRAVLRQRNYVLTMKD